MRRQFHYLAQRTEDGLIEHDREEVRQALLDLEGALHQLGGAVTISAIREQLAPDTFQTIGIVIAYDSFTPAVKRENGDTPEPFPEQIEVADGGAT